LGMTKIAEVVVVAAWDIVVVEDTLDRV
jgi:hypothetical protein